jgi:hypothetical protein
MESFTTELPLLLQTKMKHNLLQCCSSTQEHSPPQKEKQEMLANFHLVEHFLGVVVMGV